MKKEDLFVYLDRLSLRITISKVTCLFTLWLELSRLQVEQPYFSAMIENVNLMLIHGMYMQHRHLLWQSYIKCTPLIILDGVLLNSIQLIITFTIKSTKDIDSPSNGAHTKTTSHLSHRRLL